MWDKKDISKEVNRFVKSPEFEDFKTIMDDMARTKFLEVQGNLEISNHSKMIADRVILNFYMNICRDLEFRVKQISLDLEAENEARIIESQRTED